MTSTNLQTILFDSFAAAPPARVADEAQLRMLCEQADNALADFEDTVKACGRARQFAHRATGAMAMGDKDLLRALLASDAVVSATRARSAAPARFWLRRLFAPRATRRV